MDGITMTEPIKPLPVESGLSITGGESQPIPIVPVVSADEMPDLYDLFRDVVIATGVCRDVMDFEHGAFAEDNPKLHMFISQFHGGLRKWADALDKAQRERDAMRPIVKQAETAVADGYASKSMREAVIRYRARASTSGVKE
jgi:hypothetical protein